MLCIMLDFTWFVCLSTITGAETIGSDQISINILETYFFFVKNSLNRKDFWSKLY